MNTAYVYDPIYLEHDQPSHPENARRLRRILQVLEDEGMLERLTLLEPRPATPQELERVAVAWWPGGRTSPNPLAISPASTASTPRTSPPAAISAASKERGEA